VVDLASIDAGSALAVVLISVEGHALPSTTAQVDSPRGIPPGDGIAIVEPPVRA
jgi:hypothetical protein